MTNDIREKAEAFIHAVDKFYGGVGAGDCKQFKEYKDLKAALRPPREEIAETLQTYINCKHIGMNDKFNYDTVQKYIELAIEELKK